MPAYVALLRAVNLGSHNKISMADLKHVAEDAGCRNCCTLLASGNLVFESGARSSGPLETLLEKALAKHLGLETPVIVRSAAEWRIVVESNPFPAEARTDPGHLLVMALKGAISADRVKALAGKTQGRERVKAAGRELYLVYPDGVGRSKLTGAAIDRAIGVAGTARNWNTERKILARLEGD